MEWLLELPLVLGGMLFVGAVVLLFVAGMFVVRRRVSLDVLETHNEVAGFIIGVIGVIYAVLLALVVIAVWEQFEEARNRVEHEADAVGDLNRDAMAFPVPIREDIRGHLDSYARVVVAQEWPAMARGQASEQAWGEVNALWQIYLRFEPVTEREKTFYAESVARLNELADFRRLRLLASRSAMPGILWVMLVFGGVVTVGFTYFFGLRNTRAQVLMTAALAAVISIVMFVAMSMDRPFTGEVAVSPEAFELVIETMEKFNRKGI